MYVLEIFESLKKKYLFLSFLIIIVSSFLKVIWNSYCNDLLSSGKRGGGGVSITNRLLLLGVDFEIKIWQGVAEEMTGLPKNCPAPSPPPNW